MEISPRPDPSARGIPAPQGAPAERLTTLWEGVVARDPEHSARYIRRFQDMRRDGADLDGEARLIDALASRGSRILDAGCGPGRIGGELARRGHAVVGVDIDPALLQAAREQHPSAAWLHSDLAHLAAVDPLLPPEVAGGFDLIVCAGNVMTFLAPGTAPDVLAGFRERLAPGGRAVIGFGRDRGYDAEDFARDAAAAGFTGLQRFATWDLRPWEPDSGFLVALASISSDPE